MKKNILLFLVFGVLAIPTLPQTPIDAVLPHPYVLEVTYFHGRPISYDRIGSSSFGGLYERIPDWKPTSDFHFVQTVKISSRYEGKAVKVQVSCLYGPHLENEFPIAEYSIAEDGRVVANEMAKFGIFPFEFAVVRAPVGVAELPLVVNMINSLQVSVQPIESSLPSFKLVVLNNSPKPVLGLIYKTVQNGHVMIIGTAANPRGSILMRPGETFEKVLPYGLKRTVTSNGEIPETESDFEATVSSVTFADRTFEGDRSPAISMIAAKAGEKMEIKRILEVLGSSPDTLERQIATFSNARTPVDENEFRGFLASFPGLSTQETGWARYAFEAAIVKMQKLFSADFMAHRKDLLSQPGTLRAWTQAEIEQYQKWHDELPE